MGRTPIPCDLDTLAALYRAGATIAEVSQASGLSQTTTWRRLRAAGVMLRRPNTKGASL